jgi:fructose-1,6-bisphosphatase I/sedoheptulose-1,7-bisphosphatase
MPTGGRSTLIQFLIEERRRHPDATGDLNGLIADVALACKAISRKVAFGSLADVLGDHDAGSAAVNVQGEQQKTLDVLSNRIFLRANEWGGHVAAMVSEELEHIHLLPVEYPRGKYLLAFDPLDGSSNIDVNVAVGSIFSIVRAVTPEQDAATADFLQPGTRQVCAGYAIYGPSTMLVLTLGRGTHAFTLDPVLGEWVLSHPDLKVPRRRANSPSTHRTAASGNPPCVAMSMSAWRVHRAARCRFQHAVDRVPGRRNAPHTDAGRRFHVSARHQGCRNPAGCDCFTKPVRYPS